MEVVVGDVRDSSVIKSAVELATRGDDGTLDGLILNAAILGPVKPLAEDLTPEELLETFSVNVLSCAQWTQEALPALRTSQGRIIMTTSGAATSPFAGCMAYCLSKAALESLVGVLALEEPTITILAVGPGVVDTEMSRRFSDLAKPLMSSLQRAFLEEHKLSKAEEVADSFAKLILKAPQSKSGKQVDWDENWVKAL